MTFIVGMHLGAFVLLASDTRVTYYPNGVRLFHDEEIKMRRSSMGLITGAGLMDLLDPVKDQLESEPITVIDRIVEVVQAQLTVVRQQPWSKEPSVAEAIKTSGWMFTFIGTDNSTEPPTPVLRLGLVNTHELGIRAVAPNSYYMLLPTGTTREQYEEWADSLKREMKPLPDNPSVEAISDSIINHGAVAADLVRKVAAVNDGVAPTLQIGVHIPPFLTAISSIITPDGENVTFDWSGVSDENGALH